jgi:predicted nuclease of predicted toxin-antitoxin system
LKLLFDVNLSPQLARDLQDLFPGSTHVYRCGLGPCDELIWNYAKDHDFAIVTKDTDFYRMSVLQGAPPKVIWLRVGNWGTAAVTALIRRRAVEFEIFQFDALGALLVLERA